MMRRCSCHSSQRHWECVKALGNPLKTLLGLPFQDAEEEAVHGSVGDPQDMKLCVNLGCALEGSQPIYYYYYLLLFISLYFTLQTSKVRQKR